MGASRFIGLLEAGGDIASSMLPKFRYHSVYGYNAAVNTGAAEDIWVGGGTYTGFPVTGEETLSVVSASADDAAAGTGMRTMRIEGLSAAGAVINETVSLNGTTPVLTTQKFHRVSAIYGLTGGSGQTNAGDITVNHSGTTANVFGVVLAGRGEAQTAAITVPAGRQLIVRRLQFSVSGTPASSVEVLFLLETREPGSNLWRTRHTLSAKTVAGPSVSQPIGGTLIPSMTDIKISATTSGTIRAGARIEGISFPT